MLERWGGPRVRCGLVLSGGGAKGSYQIGVFQALEELGMLPRVTAVAGCSIGAINALLFAAGGPPLWREAWAAMNPDSFLAPAEGEASPPPLGEARELAQRSTKEQFLVQRPSFSQRELAAQLRRLVPPKALEEALAASELRVYCNAYNLDRDILETFRLDQRPYEAILSLVLASAALPVAYGPVAFEGSRYSDGGVMPPYAGDRPNISEKIPLSALGPEDCDLAVVVYLMQKDRVQPKQLRPGVRVLELTPSRPLERSPGSGTLDFDPRILEANRVLGYRDTMAALAPILAGCQRGETLDQLLEGHSRRRQEMLDAQLPPAEDASLP